MSWGNYEQLVTAFVWCQGRIRGANVAMPPNALKVCLVPPKQGCGVDDFPGDSDSDSDSDPPESTPTPTPESTPALFRLTLNGKIILVIFSGTVGRGLVQTSVSFCP